MATAAQRTPAVLAVLARQFTDGAASGQQLLDTFTSARVFCRRPERPGFVALDVPAAGAGPESAGLIAVFSSLAEFGAFTGGGDWFSLTGGDLLDLLPDGYGLVLDPAGAHPLRLTAGAWRTRPGLSFTFGA